MAAGRSAKRLRRALALAGVAVVCLVAFTGWQALRAKDSLELVAEDFQVLSHQLTSGDQTGAQMTLAQAQDHAEGARSNTRGPGWWLTSKLPGVGGNIAAVRTVADVVDALASNVLPDVVDATAALSPENLRPVNGRVDLAPIAEVAPRLVEADRRLQVEAAKVAALRPARLTPQVGGPVRTMQDKLGEAVQLSDRASRAVRLLPPMLGAAGPRTYLVLFQNNAEIRATGGIPGALAVISANHGRVRMHDQGSAADLGQYAEPAVPLTREEVRLFGNHLGVYPADSTFTPHFPRTGELVRAQWLRARGERVDGVLSADPVALSYLLGGTGSVSLADGTKLTAQNAVRRLLNDIYLEEPDPAAQNDYFAQAARRVFEVTASGRGAPRATLAAMVRAAGEQRLLLWSRHPAEQKLLAGTSISGELPSPGGTSPFVGVFLNDSAADKMTYYLDYGVRVAPRACNSAGRQRLEVEIRMTSTAPGNAAQLPVSVAGPGGYGNLGDIVITSFLYAPSSGWIDEALLDGHPVEVAMRTHSGFPVGLQTVSLSPGQTRVLTYTVFSGTGQPGETQVRVTPGAQSGVEVEVAPPACS